MRSTSKRLAYPLLDESLRQFGERLDHIRQDLYYCDVAVPLVRHRELRVTIQASAYVWLAAAVEALMEGVLAALLDEINLANVRLDNLRLSLFALLQAPQFDSLREVRGIKMWQARAAIFEEMSGTSSCALPADVLPLDGRTIRAYHLDAIWKIFGLPGRSTPDPLHRLVLEDLAEARNQAAHAREELSTIAQRKSLDDLLRFVDRVEEIAIHLWTQSYDYLNSKGYTRFE